MLLLRPTFWQPGEEDMTRYQQRLKAIQDMDDHCEVDAIEALHEFDQDAHELGHRQFIVNFLLILHAIALGIWLCDEAKAAKLEVAT